MLQGTWTICKERTTGKSDQERKNTKALNLRIQKTKVATGTYLLCAD